MDLLRTPDRAFADLPDWPHEPRYAAVDDLRVAYVDAGPPDADPVVLLHGEPTWSYLYRHMIGRLTADGHRVVAPDLVGFGRSDKPADPADHSYAAHVGWLRGLLVDALDLRRATLFCQDWGGLLGLRVVAEQPDRFAAVVAANTGLPTGDEPMPEAFGHWQQWAASAGDFPVGQIVAAGTARDLSAAEVAAYDAPFPEDAFKAGPRIMPALVPTRPDDPASAANRRAWQALETFEQPFLCAYSDGDPITAGADRPFRERIPGAGHDRHVTVAGGHFLQEDSPAELVAAIAAALKMR